MLTNAPAWMSTCKLIINVGNVALLFVTQKANKLLQCDFAVGNIPMFAFFLGYMAALLPECSLSRRIQKSMLVKVTQCVKKQSSFF